MDFGNWNWVFQQKKQANASTTTNNNSDTTTTTVKPDTTATREISSYDSLKHILVHLARDWGDRGNNTRQLLYTEGILPFARKYITSVGNISLDGLVDENAASRPQSVQSEESSAPVILVPGAGLGRLAVELSAAGFRCVRIILSFCFSSQNIIIILILFYMYNV